VRVGTGTYCGVAVSPDATRLVVPGADLGALHVLQTCDGRLWSHSLAMGVGMKRDTLEVPKEALASGMVMRVAWRGSEEVVASYENGTVCCWHVDTAAPLRVRWGGCAKVARAPLLSLHPLRSVPVLLVGTTGPHLVLATEQTDSEGGGWRAAAACRLPRAGVSAIDSCVFRSPEAPSALELVVTGGWDGRLRVWSIDAASTTITQLALVDTTSDGITCIACPQTHVLTTSTPGVQSWGSSDVLIGTKSGHLLHVSVPALPGLVA
jgi:WD40 repeat protein